jgi:CubicO group peptidase (beta-lactamase class C family)
MKVIRILALIIGILISIACIVLFVPWGAMEDMMAGTPDTIQEAIDDAVINGLEGIIIYVDEPSGKNTYTAGFKNREDKTLVEANTLFKIASISKLYVAVATVKLVDEKKLSLDNTLAELMPEYADRIENADTITLRLLLQHRSGIPDFVHQPNYSWLNLPKTNQDKIEFVLDKPADFKPNKKYQYSNTNYVLIGEILNKTLSYNHHEYINKEILVPLGLNNTYNLLSEANLDDVMSGYDVAFEQDMKDVDFTAPGGSMVSTAEDVGIFLRALNDGSLLTDTQQAIYSTVYEYEHTGLLPGYQSIARYFKDIDTVVIQFSSTSGGDSWAKSEILYNKVLKIIKKQK